MPAPVRNNRGEFVTFVEGVACTMLTWVDGEQRPTVTAMEEAEAIGEMIGKLHRQSSGWTIPGDFERPVFDGSRIMQTLAGLEEHARSGLLPADEAALLRRAGLRTVDMMNALERSPESWGLIHGDLNPGNIVFHGTEARPIDFGACGSAGRCAISILHSGNACSMPIPDIVRCRIAMSSCWRGSTSLRSSIR